MPVRFSQLERLTSALADAVTLDDTARAAVTELLQLDGVVRVGMALSQGGGRELRFVSSDQDALGPHWIRWCTIDGLSDVPLVRTTRTGEPVYLAEAQFMRDHPGLATKQQRIGGRSLTTVPLVVDGTCLGGLLVYSSQAEEQDTEQRGFLAAFAAQVAQAVRRGMAYHVQRTLSEELQRSLMPHSLPDLEGLEFGAHYRPGGAHVDVGGDWYDVLPLPGGAVAVSLGDVMGKGVQAAVVMSEVRTAARAYALLDPTPSTVLERLDALVDLMPSADQVVTMVYGVIDPSRTELQLAVAGHPPPLVVPSSGRPTVLEGARGSALGLGAGPWPSTTIPLEHGTGVLFYSDGLVESREQDLFLGIDTLRDAVASLADRRRHARELCARLADRLAPSSSGDDVALLAVTVAAPRSTARRTLPADPSAPGQARRFVMDVLTDWSFGDDVVERARLCVSELVTNAFIHAGGEATVTLRSDGSHLLVMVHDRGSHHRVRAVEDAPLDGISGRGLSLVEAMSSAWNVEQSTDGTLVWCELELDRDSGEGRGDLAS